MCILLKRKILRIWDYYESRVYAKISVHKVIITSFLFPSGKFSLERLQSVLKALDNDTSKLVIDLSCRRKGDTWFVAMNKWQDLTDMELTAGKSCAVLLLEPPRSSKLGSSSLASRITQKRMLTQQYRINLPSPTLLLRIPDSRSRQRRSSTRHRRGAGPQTLCLVCYPHHLCRRRSQSARLGVG